MYKKRKINEELTQAQVRSIVNSEINDIIKEKKFEKRINELASDIMERFFKMMYNKRNFWKTEIKHG